MKYSLGMVEVTGLALAITVADVMAKSANIKIEGLERVNGFGWVLVKVSGDVGSVNAAVETGAAFANTQQGLMAYKVIARPADGLGSLWSQTLPNNTPAPKKSEPVKSIEAKSSSENVSDVKTKTGSTTTGKTPTSKKAPPARNQKTTQAAAAPKRESKPQASNAPLVVPPANSKSTKVDTSLASTENKTIRTKEGSEV